MACKCSIHSHLEPLRAARTRPAFEGLRDGPVTPIYNEDICFGGALDSTDAKRQKMHTEVLRSSLNPRKTINC